MNGHTFAIVDIETTAGTPNKARIMEIAVIVHNGKRIIEEFASLVNPEEPIAPFIKGLTGISDEMVADAPTFSMIIDQVEALTQGRIFVAHNVRFDYSIVRNEFRRLGREFRRKQLCTVKMSRDIMPGLPSYSLGNLCQEVGIPIDGRHRAYGDAEATAQLLEKLIFNDRKELMLGALKDELDNALLPNAIKRKQLDELPEDPGVYYFHDQKGTILYIGKAKNIRSRVIQHFSSDLKSSKSANLKNKVFDISFEPTGNELIALLLESDEIKRYMPEFNRAQRRKNYKYGIFHEKHEDGFDRLTVRILNPKKRTPLTKVTSKKMGEYVLRQWVTKYKLDPALFGIEVEVPAEGEAEALDQQTHNKKLESIRNRYSFRDQNFFLIGDGRTPEENSVVLVEDGAYRGFGFFQPEFLDPTPESLRDVIKSYRDNPEVRKLIKQWLSKKKSAKLVRF